MNIAVCDDERKVREQIREWILELKPNCLVELFSSGEALLCSSFSFDIIFLDIQMEHMNGIETAEALRKKDEEAVLIFVTALKEYVFEAFDVSAFHYLLKPLKKERLASVFRKGVQEVEKKREQEGRQLLVRTRKRNMAIKIRDIYYIESQGRKVEIHTIKETIEMYGTMNEMEKELIQDFYRCHRGFLVNLAYVAEYGADYIFLGNGEKIYMAKEKYAGFVKAYMRYLRGGGASFV